VVGLALLHLVDVETWNIVEGVVAEAFRPVLRPQPCVEGPVVVVVVVVVVVDVVAAAFLDSTAAEALQLQDETGSSHQVR
jgi:uncharacterized membrane protein (DUF106 family)